MKLRSLAEQPQLRYSYITNLDELDGLCNRILPGVPLALDCEFIRRTTYYPTPALLQLAWDEADGLQLALLDCPAIGQGPWLALAKLLANRPVLLHAAGEDIQVLAQLGVARFTLFDTQLAAALAFGYAPCGYTQLIETLLGELLSQSKNVQRSNWLRRPLSQTQLRYALLDVVHLESLYAVLKPKLDTLGRMAWLEQECDKLFAAAVNPDPLVCWQNVKGKERLTDTQARINLHRIAAWREDVCREHNLARGLLLKDDKLLLACTKPALLDDLLAVSPLANKLPTGSLAALTARLDTPADPQLPRATRLGHREQDWIKSLQLLVGQLAKTQGVPPQLLASRRHIEAWVIKRGGYSFGRWQDALLQPTLQGFASSHFG